jgi:hypothetical protein
LLIIYWWPLIDLYWCGVTEKTPLNHSAFVHSYNLFLSGYIPIQNPQTHNYQNNFKPRLVCVQCLNSCLCLKLKKIWIQISLD